MISVDLHTGFDNLVDTSVKIKHAYFYINPLVRWQIEDKVFHHAYIVFQSSDDYWW